MSINSICNTNNKDQAQNSNTLVPLSSISLISNGSTIMNKYVKNVYHKREQAMDAFFIYPPSSEFLTFDLGQPRPLTQLHFRFYTKIVSSYVITVELSKDNLQWESCVQDYSIDKAEPFVHTLSGNMVYRFVRIKGKQVKTATSKEFFYITSVDFEEASPLENNNQYDGNNQNQKILENGSSQNILQSQSNLINDNVNTKQSKFTATITTTTANQSCLSNDSASTFHDDVIQPSPTTQQQFQFQQHPFQPAQPPQQQPLLNEKIEDMLLQMVERQKNQIKQLEVSLHQTHNKLQAAEESSRLKDLDYNVLQKQHYLDLQKLAEQKDQTIGKLQETMDHMRFQFEKEIMDLKQQFVCEGGNNNNTIQNIQNQQQTMIPSQNNNQALVNQNQSDQNDFCLQRVNTNNFDAMSEFSMRSSLTTKTCFGFGFTQSSLIPVQEVQLLHKVNRKGVENWQKCYDRKDKSQSNKEYIWQWEQRGMDFNLGKERFLKKVSFTMWGTIVYQLKMHISSDMKTWDPIIENEQVQGQCTFLYNVPARGQFIRITGRCKQVDQFHFQSIAFYEDKY